MAEKRTSDLEAKRDSKRRRRELDNKITIQWLSREYNIDIPSQNKPSIKEIHDFMIALDKRSSYPQTIAANCNRKSMLDAMQYLSDYPLKNDIILIRELDMLDNVLRHPFETPILYRRNGPLHYQNDLNIKRFLQRLSENSNSNLHVYDYSITDPSLRTRDTTVDEVHRSFPSTVDSKPLNFLDLENRTGTLYCPEQITHHDIQTQIAYQKEEDLGKIGSTWRSKPPSEFFLLSSRNAVSSIHIDNGGQLTWIKILEGRKIWYFPRSLNMGTLRLLADAGSQSPEHYRGGWVKVELCAGDILIMPPGCPHAVFTPDDCLAVGGQFWTAAHLGHSLEVLSIQQRNPDICNEDISDVIYDTLGKIIRESVMSPVEAAEVAANSSLFSDSLDDLSTPCLKSRLESRGKEPKSFRKDLIAQLEMLPSRKLGRILKEFRSNHQDRMAG